MYLYRQSTGEVFAATPFAQPFAVGYSGHGEGRNNHLLQQVDDVGPLPCGVYLIGEPFDSPRTGKYAAHLTPVTGTQMFGRSAFELHGDNPAHDASHGCLILDRPYREAIHASGDVLLVVIP